MTVGGLRMRKQALAMHAIWRYGAPDLDNGCWKRHSCQSLVYEVDSVVANASRGPSHSSASIHALFGAIGAIGANGGRGSLTISAVGEDQ